MKLPKSVQVGPFTYTVASAPLPDDRWGSCDNDERSIKLAEGIKSTQEPVTVIHEIVHAVNSVFKAELDERQVEVLAHGLAQALGSMGVWPQDFER